MEAYRVYILPVVSFVAQLDDPPEGWSQTEVFAFQQLMPGPFCWIPKQLAQNLTVIGLPVEFPALAGEIPAIRLRVYRALRKKGFNWKEAGLSLARARRDTDELVRERRWRTWYDGSFVKQVMERVDGLRQRGITTKAVEESIGHPAGNTEAQRERRIRAQFQRTARRLLRPPEGLRRARVEQVLDAYLRRWTIPTLPGRRVRVAMRVLASIRGQVPPRCQFALLRTWLNGWCTGSRFGVQGSRCSAGCDGPDSIRHYASCPRIREVARRRLGLVRRATPEEQLEDFLGLGSADTAEAHRVRVTWAGAVYRWHTHLRHEAVPATVSVRVQMLDFFLRELME